MQLKELVRNFFFNLFIYFIGKTYLNFFFCSITLFLITKLDFLDWVLSNGSWFLILIKKLKKLLVHCKFSFIKSLTDDDRLYFFLKSDHFVVSEVIFIFANFPNFLKHLTKFGLLRLSYQYHRNVKRHYRSY